ncbi:2-C-methyl-D-erythritol 4-phosphate cytidylyltransferase [Salisaeta longa]|uniref:2-C-methyl-D-erythritol 4-phosphate cytidylyltransferase n=1 Tax=Salisaeta longa TaxID=503170 RepID=UPI0003B5FA24|nr:2-C-methyl-D-erythritol 4-phosphate cytidylyltransferase [Salisaeta longa]
MAHDTEASDTAQAHEVAVLVPAAGRGTRLGGPRKQFRMLGDAPLLVQTLRAFDRHPAVGHLIVAVPSTDVQATTDRLQEAALHKLSAVVSGGASRQASVAHALRAVPSPVEVVLVHDAVRPFIRPNYIEAVIEASRTHGAAALAVPVADTLRRGADGTFQDTVPRDGLYRMQTPQGFRRAWLERAHQAPAPEAPRTDDVGLVQAQGHTVHIVEGSARNFKVTTPSDWALAQQLWPHWSTEPLQ